MYNQILNEASCTDADGADPAVVWSARPNLRLDIGANVGLNRNTPNVVSHIGVSIPF